MLSSDNERLQDFEIDTILEYTNKDNIVVLSRQSTRSGKKKIIKIEWYDYFLGHSNARVRNKLLHKSK